MRSVNDRYQTSHLRILIILNCSILVITINCARTNLGRNTTRIIFNHILAKIIVIYSYLP